MNTILNSAQEVLGSATVSVLDSTRFVRNILDAKPSDSKLTDAQFILKVIEVGLRNVRAKEMSLTDGFALYLKIKQHLRPDSIRDTMKPWQNAKQFAIHANIGRLPPICDTCQYWKASARLGMGKCLKCGCTSLKLKFDTESCPTGKW